MWEYLFTTLASILFVVDPAGALPAYLAITGNESSLQRRRTAFKASFFATLTMAAFAAAGNMLFRLLHLTMPAFQIAGGLILFLVALDMIRAQRLTQEAPDEVREGIDKSDAALTPLAIPMLAGPASLSTVAMLMSRAGTVTEVVIIYGVILFTGVITFVTLMVGEPVHRALGRSGIHVLSRIFGLILAALAVQFVLDGIQSSGILPPG